MFFDRLSEGRTDEFCPLPEPLAVVDPKINAFGGQMTEVRSKYHVFKLRKRKKTLLDQRDGEDIGVAQEEISLLNGKKTSGAFVKNIESDKKIRQGIVKH